MALSRSDTWAFRFYSTLFYLLLGLDCLAEARSPLWTAYSAITVSKLPGLFEDTLGWVPSGDDLRSAYYVCTLCCVFSILSPHLLYPFVSITVTVLYNFAYFATALNRYQHKYMLCMILWIMPFAAHSSRANRSLRTFTGIVYGFTALTKIMDSGVFASGRLLPSLLMKQPNHDLVDQAADMLSVDALTLWALISTSTIICEVALSFCLIKGIYVTPAIMLGVSMHAGIHLSSVFKIGFFTYYMLGFYVLLLPGAFEELRRLMK